MKGLNLKGKIRLAISYVTYYPVTLCLWMQIPNNYTHTSSALGTFSNKQTILKDILKMDYRRHWLRSIVEDEREKQAA